MEKCVTALSLKSWLSVRLVALALGAGLACLLVGCGGTPDLTTGRSLPATPSISWATPAPISYGTALSATQLDATASVPGTFAYSPSLGAVLNAGSQKLSVTFTPADTTEYTTATASVTIQVNPATPSISWAAPAAIVFGTGLSGAQLDATASVSGTFAYSPAAGAVLAAGTQTLTATFTPADAVDYTSATASVTLMVEQATPVVRWSPAPLAVGMPLGPSQLNATAFTPGGATALAGSFLYSPAAGTTFSSPWPETLTVTFTPADATDYSSVEASTSLNVAPFGVAAWGDSLTSGDEGNTDQAAYPAELAPITSLPVENLGVSGQTSTEIGVREGAIPAYVTVAGGAIPASGGVTVSFNSGHAPVTGSGPVGGVPGTILGVHGVATFVSGVWSFARTAAGDAVSAPGTPQFVVDTPYATYLPIFWEGRNNFGARSQVLSDIAAQVATVPAGQTYLVMSIINENTQDEWAGGASYDQIVSINNQLANLYGAHYIDVRRLLVESYDPTLTTDVSDFSHDEPPTSLHAIMGSTTLAAAVGPADTTLTLNANAGADVHRILTLDTGANAENVQVTQVEGTTVTVIRNMGGLNTAHAAGASVTVTDPLHLNAQGYQVVAQSVAQFLSVYASGPE